MIADRVLSVRSRVTAGATAVLTIALIIAALTAAGLLRRALTTDARGQLVDRIDLTAGLLSAGLLTPIIEPTGREIGQVQVIDSKGTVLAATPGLAGATRLNAIDAPPLNGQRSAIVSGARIDGEDDERYVLLVRTVDGPTGPLAIYAVTSLDTAERAERYLRNSLLLGLPALVAVTGLVIWRVVHGALAPVEAMRAEVDRIEATDLSARIAVVGNDEIARLGRTLNHFLRRLDDAAASQKLFASAASHELRSPLSAIRTELEVALTYPERAEWPNVAADALVEVNRLEDLAQDLRSFTRAGATLPNRTVVELSELVSAELDRRRPPPPLTYVRDLVAVPMQLDSDLVTQVVRNLLDNAERHARSVITVRLVPVVDGVELIVANDGEPIPTAERDRIFEPFHRLDEARGKDAGGSGLGLAISRTAMIAHGGSLSAAPVPTGAEFHAWFPSACRL